MNKITYKGYNIIASPDQLVKNKEWTINITIEKDSGHHVS
jgi:hypothetical protein